MIAAALKKRLNEKRQGKSKEKKGEGEEFKASLGYRKIMSQMQNKRKGEWDLDLGCLQLGTDAGCPGR